MPVISPSILAADFFRLGEDVSAAISAGVKTFHLDIMDGHFVCNVSFGADISKVVIDNAPGIPTDAHLMVTHPEEYIQSFAAIGVELLTFHLEIDSRRIALPGGRWVYHATEVRYASRIERIIELIKKAGMKVGLAVNPPTDPKVAAPFMDSIDRFLLMSVNPGFGGQKFIEETYAKIERTANYRAKKNLKFDIQVDGGVVVENAARLAELGVDNLVCGSGFFAATDYSIRLSELNEAIQSTAGRS